MLRWINDKFLPITLTLFVACLVIGIGSYNKSYNNCHTATKDAPMHQSLVTCPVGQDIERVTSNANQRQTKEQKNMKRKSLTIKPKLKWRGMLK